MSALKEAAEEMVVEMVVLEVEIGEILGIEEEMAVETAAAEMVATTAIEIASEGIEWVVWTDEVEEVVIVAFAAVGAVVVAMIEMAVAVTCMAEIAEMEVADLTTEEGKL